MRQRILIIVFFALVVAALVGLNAVSYTKQDKLPDSEIFPNRSTYNTGTTGTSAFYNLLSETGYKVTRWQQPPSDLVTSAGDRISVLVMIGGLNREVTPEASRKILSWVARGGRLVVIDREPVAALLEGGHNWKLSAVPSEQFFADPNMDKPGVLTDKIPAAKPVQPTTLVSGVNAVQLSKLASKIILETTVAPKETGAIDTIKETVDYYEDPPPAAPSPTPIGIAKKASTPPFTSTPAKEEPDRLYDRGEIIDEISDDDDTTGGYIPADQYSRAPVIHLSNTDKDILADVPLGSGRIIFLSDPYIVSNAGIRLVDNSTLAINLARAKDGMIAFDEYHQGFGSDNTLLGYFSGTPVLAIAGQALLLILVVVWTQGTRFARPLPLPAKDRRSKLEYVAAMADLQRSTRSYDLAIENVYSQIKREMIRIAGADNKIPRKQLAETISERTGYDAKDLYTLMAKCEDIIHGEPTNAKETMNLISQLRLLEEKIGFRRARTSRLK